MENLDFKGALRVYFLRLFPFDDLFRWLNCGKENVFSCRELALNFDGERYLRNQAYSNINELRCAVKKYNPVKIDVGAVYNISPIYSMREKVYYPVQRELVFDIDLTDYDEIRTCCSGVDICSKCWKYIVVAVKILDIALREDFGFDNILWTFSGRRGIHCWVSDKEARFLKYGGRIAVANYLQLVTGGEYKKKKVEIKNKIHHSVKRALLIIEPVFIEMCVEEQNMLGSEERVFKFLGILDKEEIRIEVKNVLDQYSSSLTRWTAFVNFFKYQLEMGSEKWSRTPFLIEEIMIQYAYPRLDIHVTMGMSHLLKSPFCVHPNTGKIGVPIDPKNIDQFHPQMAPNIVKLLDEIDQFDSTAKKQGMSNFELKGIEDIKKTSLSKYLDIFQRFIDGLENSNEDNI